MNKKPIFISFATQKGGAGKTTLSILVASMAHYLYGYNVAVIDCDQTQYSFSGVRKYEERYIYESDALKRVLSNQVMKHNHAAYPIIPTKIKLALDAAEELIQRSDTEYDFIFFDITGSAEIEGWLTLTLQMDYVFVPFVPDMLNINSTYAFAKTINGEGGNLFAFWNEVDVREKTDLIDKYNKAMENDGIYRLQTNIPYLARFHKKITDYAVMNGVFMSTLLAPTPNLLSGSRMDLLCDEIFNITKK